jgi:hypothetical protein
MYCGTRLTAMSRYTSKTRNMRTEKASVVVMPAKMASGRVTTQRKGTMSPYTRLGIGIVSRSRRRLS